jgi:gluconolactonase
VEAARARRAKSSVTEHQKALFFALRELTGKDPGPTAEDWKRAFVERVLKSRLRHSGFRPARGLAVDTSGNIYVSDGAAGRIVRFEGDRRPEVFLKEFAANGLALSKGRLLVCQGTSGRILAVDVATRESKVLASGPGGKRFNNPRSLAVDAGGGVYVADGSPLEGSTVKGGAYYISAHGTVTSLAINLPRPRGLALSPDGKTLYAVGTGSADVLAYPLEGAGLLGTGKVICRLDGPHWLPAQGASGLAVDGKGNLYVLNLARRCLQVFNSAGAKLGMVPLSDIPVACAIGGKGTLYILTTRALHTMELAPATTTTVRSR